MKRKSPFETVLKAKHDNAHAFSNVKKGPLSTIITLTKQSPIKWTKKRERVWVVVLVKDISRTYTIAVASRPSNQGVATKIVIIIYDRLPFDSTDRQDLRVR